MCISVSFPAQLIKNISTTTLQHAAFSKGKSWKLKVHSLSDFYKDLSGLRH